MLRGLLHGDPEAVSITEPGSEWELPGGGGLGNGHEKSVCFMGFLGGMEVAVA